jgi:hypothetical protein
MALALTALATVVIVLVVLEYLVEKDVENGE